MARNREFVTLTETPDRSLDYYYCGEDEEADYIPFQETIEYFDAEKCFVEIEVIFHRPEDNKFFKGSVCKSRDEYFDHSADLVEVFEEETVTYV